jgi:hypothetical protein
MEQSGEKDDRQGYEGQGALEIKPTKDWPLVKELWDRGKGSRIPPPAEAAGAWGQRPDQVQGSEKVLTLV